MVRIRAAIYVNYDIITLDLLNNNFLFFLGSGVNWITRFDVTCIKNLILINFFHIKIILWSLDPSFCRYVSCHANF